MKTISNFSIKEKNVLLRVDFNVPVVEGKITEKSRILSIKSTIKKLIKDNNKIFLISHFGRPKGIFNKKLSLEFLCPTLVQEFEINKIHFVKIINNKNILKTINTMKLGEVCLLENIRFYEGEEKNDLNFSKELTKNFDVYVNDAFSASHRKHASIVRVTQFLPSIAGDSLLREIKNLELFIKTSRKPSTAIIGGSKISTKINIIHNLVKYFDNIIIGGAMANTFLFAQGFEVGESLVEQELKETAKTILERGRNFNCNIILPVDVVCSNHLNDSINVRHSEIKNVLSDQMILDLGNQTIQIIIKTILKSNMVLWNGPLGAFEHEPFNNATIKIAEAIKNNAKLLNIIALAGGGDTISAIKMANAEEGFSYISQAGGAFLEWLEGKESPGVNALEENQLS